MTEKVYVEPGADVPLDRAGLSGPAPGSVRGLLSLCERWAAEVGWELTADADVADGAVVGPGVQPPGVRPPGAADGVVRVERAQGIDGFRWGIRHLAFARRWPAETVAYGLAADQVADVRRPRRGRAGVAVLLHGGFWMQAWRRDLMDGLAVDLSGQGWETWNVEYGRVGGTGGWPQTGVDVLTAIDAVVEASAAETVTLIGHSAGGQLALWAAAQRREIVGRAVSLAGLCDLASAARQRLGGGAVERLLAGAPAADASPLHHVPIGVPVVLAHCADDSVVPIDQSERFAQAATAAGDQVALVAIPAGDHMALIEPDAAWRSVRPHLHPTG